MDWLEDLYNLALKALALPSFHAIVTALGVGFAVTYLLALPLPAKTPLMWAVRWSRVVIATTVFGTAVYLVPTPTVVAWGFTVAILTPRLYEMVMDQLYHWKPWLKPKSLLTGPEMQVRIKDKLDA